MPSRCLPGRHPVELVPLTMHGLWEPTPGPHWQALFHATWPAYRRWFLRDGDSARPSRQNAARALARHMPELVATWERLVALAGGGDLPARMLTCWDPPAFQPGCSQAVVLTGSEPLLVRNYDYDPRLLERVVFSSAFTGRRVVGTSDCLWGLLDGVNDGGLAVSLAFGGCPGTGAGFGIGLVVRYLLEVCESVPDVARVLRRLPVNATYNLTAVDRSGEHATYFVGPDREPERHTLTAVTNHRGRVPDWPDYARRIRSVERQEAMAALLARGTAADELVAAFLRPPLRSTAWAEGFGTLYAAAYRPAAGVVDYLWPDSTWRRSFDAQPETHTAVLAAGGRPCAGMAGSAADVGGEEVKWAGGLQPGGSGRARDAGACRARACRPAGAGRPSTRRTDVSGSARGVGARRNVLRPGRPRARRHRVVVLCRGVRRTSRQAAWARWHL